MTSSSPGGRRYSGLDAEQRRDVRHRAILDAGLDLYGTQGYAAVSVKQVCDRARLTQRYFYESFVDREALLRAVYEETIQRVQALVLTAVGTAGDGVLEAALAGVGAFVDALTGDERVGRVILLEVVGVSEALETRRHEVIHQFADLILAIARQRLSLTGDPQRQALAAVALVGSVNQLLVDWITTPQARSDPALIRDVLADLFQAAFDVLSGSTSTPTKAAAAPGEPEVAPAGRPSS